MSEKSSRRIVVAATALALAVALSGCAGASPSHLLPVPSATFPAVPAATVAPGTALALGAVATLPVTKTSTSPVELVETSVVSLTKGDKSLWKKYNNAEDFEKNTPWFYVVQYRWAGDDAGTKPTLYPYLSNGGQAQTVTTTLGVNPCPFELPDPANANEESECLVAAAPDGLDLTQIKWLNVGKFTIFKPDPAVNPYFDNPVVWG